jgi:hypothetical protein
VRAWLFIAVFPALLSAQDPREIVRRSIELDRHNNEIARQYTFLQRAEERELDGAGKVKHTESNTEDVTLLEGSPYYRRVAHNDQPLAVKEEKQEQERLQKSIDQRRKETPEQRQRRVADWERRQEKQREAFREIPEAFDLKLVREERLNGGETWVIDASPKRGYKPKSRAASYFVKMKARFWIDKADYQWVKLDVDITDTITFGGVLFRIAKGGHLSFEQTRINDEVWLPKSISGKGQMRIALVKVLRGELLVSFSNYKKFQTDSRIVSAGQ